MTLFRTISGLALLLLFAALAYDLKRQWKNWNAVREFLVSQMRLPLLVWQKRQALLAENILLFARRIVFLLTVLVFLLLAITGFVPLLVLGDHLTGILLVIHVTVAPLFALSLSALALLWAHRLRFLRSDGEAVRELINNRYQEKENIIRFAWKTCFWLVSVLSLPLMLTVILGLYPLFGTEGEEVLIRLHGYSALFLMLVAIVHLYLTIAYVKQSPEQFVKE
jgi:cytochrome b subunit of formate dehydrogenase